MSNCIFPMVNAWNSKKPISYWRNFTPKDIPLADLNQNMIKYYEWNNNFKCWILSLLCPIKKDWSVSNISKMIKIHSRLIEGGIHGTVIVEVHPKFRIGKYKNGIEVLHIYAENSQYSYPRKVFDIYETEYYIKHQKDVGIVTETDLEQMINSNDHCFVYSYKKGKDTFLHIKSKTRNPKNEKRVINNILSTPGLKFHFPKSATFQYNSTDKVNWEYIGTKLLSNKLWAIQKNSEPTIEIDNNKNAFNMHFTFMNFKKYYEGQIAKIKLSNYRDGLDSAFLNTVKTNRTKTVSSRIGRPAGHKSPNKKNHQKNTDKSKNDEPVVYIKYKQLGKIKLHRCPMWQAIKLRDKHPEVEMFTVAEYKKLYPVKKNKDQKSVIHTKHNRRQRRLEKQKLRGNNRLVKVQYIPVPINDKKVRKYPHIPHPNVKSGTDKYITPSSITGAVIKVNGELVAKDSMKPIYHYVKPNNNSIIRHNAKAYVKPLLLELKEKYGAYDRRYTVNSDVENWSIRFFIALKMVRDQVRHKKIIHYLMDICGHSKEFAEGFLKYLQLTRNGDPTREHIRNLPKRYSRIKVTKPHVSFDAPYPRQQLVIEHSVTNEDEGGIKNIITGNVYAVLSKKEGLNFFKYNAETNEQEFVSSAKDIIKWAYVQEYTGEPETTKWHTLVMIGEKEVEQVVKHRFHIESRVKGTKLKDWKTPFPIDKTVKYLIKKLNLLYKAGNEEMLYAFIRNTIMEEYKNSTELYDKLRFTLYHNYSGLSKSIVTLIKVNKMNDPDLVIFMEDLTHPHFN